MKKVSIIFISVFISSFISSQGNSDLEELVVSGIFIPDEKRSTSEISNLISSSEMSEAGDSNIADALTKYVNQYKLEQHMRDTSQELVSGRHGLMPEVSKGI